ncbi:hypothetical protein SASPL_132501 [Salvia splendens]|uniref:Uncharacterized protein n=1 Tax=Salvia splendens TaxID=180675 RepID=A0A8X8ZI91_SALSN|nr:hypothetical protein SASPL_132501 [Salvia splendens]
MRRHIAVEVEAEVSVDLAAKHRWMMMMCRFPLRKEKDLLLAKVRKLEEEEISFRGESEAEKELASRIPVSRNPSGDDAV